MRRPAAVEKAAASAVMPAMCSGAGVAALLDERLDLYQYFWLEEGLGVHHCWFRYGLLAAGPGRAGESLSDCGESRSAEIYPARRLEERLEMVQSPP